MLPVGIAVSNAKFHSSQDKTSQSIVVTVSRNINHKTEEEDLVEEAQVVEEEALTEDHEKCTKQLVEIAVKNAKSHSSQKETNQSIAVNVFKIIKEIKNNCHFIVC